MRINYLLGLPTFLMVIGLAWASQSHADWENAYNELDYEDGLPEVDSLLPDDSRRSSFELGAADKQKTAVPDQTMLDLAKQFDAIQHEVQELRGRVETQDHELKLLKKQAQQLANVNTNVNTNVSNASNVSQKPASSLNSNSGLGLNSAGITYKPAGT